MNGCYSFFLNYAIKCLRVNDVNITNINLNLQDYSVCISNLLENLTK